MRQREWKIILIAAAILMDLAIILAVYLLWPRTSDAEVPSQGIASDVSTRAERNSSRPRPPARHAW